ncbi:Fic family protein [Candidatus Peregrinibacteria bacterium]|nr:Fic family protein [Candidatus Peregrinibacteria bacterium]
MSITRRQQAILDVLHRTSDGAATRDILLALAQSTDRISRVTVIRDLGVLVAGGFVRRTGKGRNVRYREKLANTSLRHVDPEAYFSVDDAERPLVHPTYHSSALDAFSGAFTKKEREQITALNDAYRRRLRALPLAIIRKETERFTTEFSWKSSRIEGNTYSLLDTEMLLKEQKEAQGHTHQEAQMILNHKTALDFIFSHPGDYSSLKRRTIEQLHALIMKELGVAKGLRGAPVGILGTSYRPMGLRSQLHEALGETVMRINAEPWVPAKALIALLMIAYIQPFEDGNKRTARLLGNALLIAGRFCPLSFRSIDEKEYKKAVILFYEQHNIAYFKNLFLEQFVYAARQYFQAGNPAIS